MCIFAYLTFRVIFTTRLLTSGSRGKIGALRFLIGGLCKLIGALYLKTQSTCF